MKHSGIFLVLLLLTNVVFLRAEDAPKPAPGIEGTKMLVDLRAELPGLFSYSTWQGNFTVTPSGHAILGSKGAQGNGGLGRELSPAMDLGAVAFVEVALGTLAGNEVPEITIALNDADGTQFSARVPVDQLVPGQPVWLRARRENFRLNSVEPGKDSVMDWSRVVRWHVQGDWTTRRPIQMIFVALRTRR
jgi:hypothetical protein